MRDFRALFQGGPKQHWLWTPADKANAVGKVGAKTKPKDVSGTPNDEAWAVHEAGTDYSIIITPNLPDRTALFGVIDIDPASAEDKGEHVARDLFELLANKGLPFVVTESKSLGAHAWVFFTEPEQATEVMRVLEHIVLSLDLKGVFKCGSIDIRPTKEGAGIQVPYWGATRRMPKLEGGFATRDEFVAYINDHCVVDLPELRRIVQTLFGELKSTTRRQVKAAQYEDKADVGPPCFEKLLEPGAVGEGMRNHAITHLAARMKHMFPDDWEDLLIQAAYTFDPPLRKTEVETVIASYNRHGFGLLCENPSIKPFCNKELCMTRKFGVLSQVTLEEQIDFTITKIIKYVEPGEEQQDKYTLQIFFDGHEGYIHGTELTWSDAHRFRQAYWHRYGRWVNVGTQKRFEKMMQELRGQLGSRYFEQEVPREFSRIGIFEKSVKDFVKRRLWKDPQLDRQLFNRGWVMWDATQKLIYIPAQQLADDISASTQKKIDLKRSEIVPKLLETLLVRPDGDCAMMKYRFAGATHNVICMSPRIKGEEAEDELGWFEPPEHSQIAKEAW